MTKNKKPRLLSDTTPVEPTPNMLKYADLAKKIAQRIFGIEIEVKFAEWPGTVHAQYGNRTLTLNIKLIPKEFFESLSLPLLDLTINELAHEAGEHNYHAACTQLGANLTMIALKEPDFFGLELSRIET